MDETYLKIQRKRRDLYRAVNRDGQTIDFLLTAHRGKAAALRFLKIELVPMLKKGQMITVDGQDLAAAERFYAWAT